MNHNKRFFSVIYEHNWGTRWPRSYFTVHIFATSRSDALRRFNKHWRKGNEDCRVVSDSELPESVGKLPHWYYVKEITVLDYPGV